MNDLPLLFHSHHQQEGEDLPFWLNWAQRRGGPILELGCGTGRVLLPLAAAGHVVIGLEKDADMLDFLRQRVPGALRGRVALLRGDFRSLCLANRFPLIVLSCNTYSTLPPPDRLVLLKQVRPRLALEGVFIASMPNPRVLADLPGEGDSEIEVVFPHPLSGHPVQVSSCWARAQQTVIFRWHYDHLLSNGQVERQTLSTRHFLQEPEEIFEAIEQAGLRLAAAYGDYQGAAYRPDSALLIVVAQGV
jgi:SAM-dependent methyltransferase